MKQLLFLLLFPCLALAQYTGNAGQKITLGEQTTADGLVFRGVASIDTVTATSKITRANKQDTSAFILLDTVTNLLWHYKIGSNGWIQAGGGVSVSSFSAGTTGLTPSTATTGAVTLGGTLAVANGGTGATSFSPNNYLIRTNSSGVFDTSAIYEANGNVGIGTNTPSTILTVSSIGFTDTKFRVEQRRNGIASEMAMVGANDDGARFNRFNSQTNGNNIFHWQIGGGGAINTMAMLTANIERMRITSDGNVGIGTASPAALLDVRSTMRVSGDGINFGSSVNDVTLSSIVYTNGTGGIDVKSYAKLGLYAGGSERIHITSDGNVGIGTTAPLALLNVMGTVRINSASAPDANYYLQLENSASQKAKANAWDTYSDKRIKTDIQPIYNAIDKVNSLNPVYYQKHDSYVENDFLNIDYDSSVKSLGFIAQEVYNIIPEAVNTGTTNELWAMDYTKIIPILTKAIQEQQALIKALEQRILILENK